MADDKSDAIPGRSAIRHEPSSVFTFNEFLFLYFCHM
jgi:hypothetical protein